MVSGHSHWISERAKPIFLIDGSSGAKPLICVMRATQRDPIALGHAAPGRNGDPRSMRGPLEWSALNAEAAPGRAGLRRNAAALDRYPRNPPSKGA